MKGSKMKKNPKKARGIRFSDEQWEAIVLKTNEDKTGRTTPSDVVRHVVKQFFGIK